ncbi:MAG: endonuclease/exonuclease/phosphatase family protein [Gammaproteobacteria bacterium]
MGNTAWNASRKPLAAEFTYNGHKLFVIVNHFNSKGGDQGLFGPQQPPVLSSEVQRNQQATLLAAFVGDILAADPTANVAVVGDLNDFQFSPPVQKLKDAGLTAMIETLPPNERYSALALRLPCYASHVQRRCGQEWVVHRVALLMCVEGTQGVTSRLGNCWVAILTEVAQRSLKPPVAKISQNHENKGQVFASCEGFFEKWHRAFARFDKEHSRNGAHGFILRAESAHENTPRQTQSRDAPDGVSNK